jgi:hypothetical protein
MNLIMPSATPEQLRLGLAIAVGLLVLVVLQQLVRRWRARRRLALRFAAARRGESRGRGLLEASGYTVLGAQCAQSYVLSLDGVEVEIQLRADYVVTRDGLRFVAEVKTGALAPLLRTPATRRQLLEYRVAFDVDGVLLVDADARRIHVVQFPLAEPRAAESMAPLGWIVVAVGILAVVVAGWR